MLSAHGLYWRVVKYITVGLGGVEFDSRAVQIGPNVANDLPQRRRFFEVVLAIHEVAEIRAPPHHHTLRRNTASVIRI